uniref:Uncharacterized protein n=1 Tax=mine drainage metagenome TaxID=410659 RepID=E6QQF7_9ZZZZ
MSKSVPATARDVSILAHPGGWALQANFYCQGGFNSVSILAHPGGWALPLSFGVNTLFNEFQSSPTPEGGRYLETNFYRRFQIGFNPRPPRRVGATTKLALRA